MKFELELPNRDVADEQLLQDIRECAEKSSRGVLTYRDYQSLGRFGVETIRRRFGSWNAALTRAGVALTKRWRVPNKELFANLAEIWIRLGRQPRRGDLDEMASRFSDSVYEQRFGSWTQALKEFVTFADGTDIASETPIKPRSISVRRTPREPSLRLRFTVMRRDRFRCCQCGASPSINAAVQLVIDHVRPWSDGGETEFANLQTLCQECNLGKSNLAPFV
jgi:hypothetical protein